MWRAPVCVIRVSFMRCADRTSQHTHAQLRHMFAWTPRLLKCGAGGSQYMPASTRTAPWRTSPPDAEYPEMEDEAPVRARRPRSRSRSQKRVTWAEQPPPPSQQRTTPRNGGRGRGKPAPGIQTSASSGQTPVPRNGIQFCKKFGKGQCVDGKCPNGFVHACAHIDEVTGKLCGKLNHRACHHGVHHW